MGNRRIHIENKPGPKGGFTIAVTDADTGELLTDLSSITIKMAVDDVVVADMSSLGGVTQTRYVESIDAVISGQAVEKHEEVEEASQEVRTPLLPSSDSGNEATPC